MVFETELNIMNEKRGRLAKGWMFLFCALWYSALAMPLMNAGAAPNPNDPFFLDLNEVKTQAEVEGSFPHSQNRHHLQSGFRSRSISRR